MQYQEYEYADNKTYSIIRNKSTNQKIKSYPLKHIKHLHTRGKRLSCEKASLHKGPNIEGNFMSNIAKIKPQLPMLT